MLCFVDVALSGLRFPLNGRCDHETSLQTLLSQPGAAPSSAPALPSPARRRLSGAVAGPAPRRAASRARPGIRREPAGRRARALPTVRFFCSAGTPWPGETAPWRSRRLCARARPRSSPPATAGSRGAQAGASRGSIRRRRSGGREVRETRGSDDAAPAPGRPRRDADGAILASSSAARPRATAPSSRLARRAPSSPPTRAASRHPGARSPPRRAPPTPPPSRRRRASLDRPRRAVLAALCARAGPHASSSASRDARLAPGPRLSRRRRELRRPRARRAAVEPPSSPGARLRRRRPLRLRARDGTRPSRRLLLRDGARREARRAFPSPRRPRVQRLAAAASTARRGSAPLREPRLRARRRRRRLGRTPRAPPPRRRFAPSSSTARRLHRGGLPGDERPEPSLLRSFSARRGTRSASADSARVVAADKPGFRSAPPRPPSSRAAPRRPRRRAGRLRGGPRSRAAALRARRLRRPSSSSLSRRPRAHFASRSAAQLRGPRFGVRACFAPRPRRARPPRRRDASAAAVSPARGARRAQRACRRRGDDGVGELREVFDSAAAGAVRAPSAQPSARRRRASSPHPRDARRSLRRDASAASARRRCLRRPPLPPAAGSPSLSAAAAAIVAAMRLRGRPMRRRGGGARRLPGGREAGERDPARRRRGLSLVFFPPGRDRRGEVRGSPGEGGTARGLNVDFRCGLPPGTNGRGPPRAPARAAPSARRRRALRGRRIRSPPAAAESFMRSGGKAPPRPEL